MDLLAIHARALASTGTVVDGIAPTQLESATPCPELDVRSLLSHLVGGNHRFLAAAQGVAGADVPLSAEAPDDDWSTAYRTSATALADAWREPGALDRTVELPLGQMPGAAAVGMHVVETVVHGWDLATATGQSAVIDPELCAAAWQFTRNVDDSLRGPGGPFGPAVEVPNDASPTDQLVAWLGRRP